MLSLIVSEAARGVNIAERFPTFYQQMMADPQLRERFEESLELLRQTENNTLLPLPGPLSHDLSFLQARPRPQIIACTSPEGSRLTIHLNLTQLTTRLFPPSTSQVVRSGISLGLDEDNWFPLFRETVTTEAGVWAIWLEGTPIDEEDERLQLVLYVYPAEAVPEKNHPGQARLQWGPYQEMVQIDRYGRASFPPLSLEQVVEVTAQTVRFDLNLEIY